MFIRLNRYIPYRKCVGCQAIRPKNQLIRIIKNSNGIFIDKEQKLSGRGAYLCKSIDCLNIALKRKGLEKSLKVQLPRQFYEDVKRFVEFILSKSTEVSE